MNPLKLVIASRNPDKVREIKSILSGLPIEITSLLEYAAVPPIPEEGKTMRENALTKARTVARLLERPALADDSGLEVEALGGLPGVKSARFAGENVSYADNNRLLLEMMREVPAGERGARFVCVAALVDPVGGGNGSGSESETVVEGEVRGVITTEPRGGGGFGYDPVFLVPELGYTFGEVGLAAKERFSHRARAFRRMREVLEKRVRARSH